mgnify:CR=1 FL=1
MREDPELDNFRPTDIDTPASALYTSSRIMSFMSTQAVCCHLKELGGLMNNTNLNMNFEPWDWQLLCEEGEGFKTHDE